MNPLDFPTIDGQLLPALTTEQMREVDRLMVQEFSISLLQMMENAGRNLADLVQAALGGEVHERSVLVLAGRGANGGGGLAAARHLANRCADVQVITAHPFDTFFDVPAQQLDALLALGASVTTSDAGWELPDADLVVDALIGYGLNGDPRSPIAEIIRLAASHPAPIIALDAPSGLDTTSGRVFTPCIRADATLTLALPKKGLLQAPGEIVGDLYLADISVPAALYEYLDIEPPPLFTRGPILRVVT